MPEYLAPGVYVEETSYRAKSIEGVSTSTAGFVGPTRSGPTSGKPEVLTSFSDFQRVYGGLDDLSFGTNFLAHGARAFFEEGGARITGAGQGSEPITAGGPAELAGLQPGDVITMVDDRPITSPGDLIVVLGTYTPGDTVRVTYLRNGEEQAPIQVELGSFDRLNG